MNDKIVGVIGCEYEKQFGLLRSALVDKQYRKKGIAESLTKVLLQTAKKENYKAIYLFSTGAGKYWTNQGFKPTTVKEVIENLKNTPQVKLFEKLGWLPSEIAFKFNLIDL